MYWPLKNTYAAIAAAAHSSQRRPLRCSSVSRSLLALECLQGAGGAHEQMSGGVMGYQLASSARLQADAALPNERCQPVASQWPPGQRALTGRC